MFVRESTQTRTLLNITKPAHLHWRESRESHCGRQSTHKITKSSVTSTSWRAYGQEELWLKARQRNKGHCVRKIRLVTIKSNKPKEKGFLVPVRVPDLGFHKLSLLYAFSSVKGISNNASSIDDNLIIQQRVQYVMLRSKGFLRELQAEVRSSLSKHRQAVGYTITWKGKIRHAMLVMDLFV